MEEMTEAARSNGIWSATTPGMAVIKDPIRTHWGLKSDVFAGEHKIPLKEAAYIEKGYTLYIGPLPGGTGTGESFYIYDKQGNDIYAQKGEYDIDPLSYNHPAAHTVQSTTYGFKGKVKEGSNFAVLSQDADQYIVTHEFLHLTSSGMLLHVTDKY